jgi:hypothetical protein
MKILQKFKTHQRVFARVVLKLFLYRIIAVKSFRIFFRFVNNAFNRIHFTIQHSTNGRNNIGNQERSIFLLNFRIWGFVALWDDVENVLKSN